MNKDTSLGEVVSNNFRTARILEHYGLDYCCGGDRTIAEACKDKDIPARQILSELRLAEGTEQSVDYQFSKKALEDIINHIVTHHHRYIKSSIPVITQRLRIVCDKHGKRHPHLADTLMLFLKLGDELTLHMMREEKILFPYIQKLAQAKRTNTKLMLPVVGSFESVMIPIEAMEREHVNAGSLTNEMRDLCNDYTPPKDACQTYRTSYMELAEFESDLHMHIHLENNILFPGAILLEGELKALKLK